MTQILLVEDEADLADALQIGLEESGYAVQVARDGVAGEELARSNEYDVLVVDWMLPRQDGLSLVQRLRAAGFQRPILMLTALADLDDRVRGLDAGADDYLTKPFAFEELLARLRALVRRAAAQASEAVLKAGPLEIDLMRRTVVLNGQPLELRTKEFALLELLVRRADTVVTRAMLAERVWSSSFTSDDVINMTVSSLRRKLREATPADAETSLQIKTVRGVGYCLAPGS